MSRAANLSAVLLTAGLVAAIAACGGGGDDGSRAGAAGQSIAKDNGCQACHRLDGDGVGPTWTGLYGSTVTLEDGSTVVADDAYLRMAISDPGAQVVGGFNVSMPENSLTDDQIDEVIAYIQTLVTPGRATGTSAG